MIACVCVGLAVAVWRAPVRFALPLAIVLGGAAGNLIDRLRFGYVVDYVGLGPWPTFNVGDVAILVGAALIVVRVLLARAARPPRRRGLRRACRTSWRATPRPVCGSTSPWRGASARAAPPRSG